MRIKLDENLPEALLRALSDLGHDVDNIRLEGLAGQDDSVVWRAAQVEHRFLITQDLDFSDLRKFAPGTHCGLLLVRLRLPGRRALTERLTAVISTHAVEDWARCFVLVSDLKIRVHRPA